MRYCKWCLLHYSTRCNLNWFKRLFARDIIISYITENSNAFPQKHSLLLFARTTDEVYNINIKSHSGLRYTCQRTSGWVFHKAMHRNWLIYLRFFKKNWRSTENRSNSTVAFSNPSHLNSLLDSRIYQNCYCDELTLRRSFSIFMSLSQIVEKAAWNEQKPIVWRCAWRWSN
jgi:hypothetical protein